ncbi:MAG: TlpA disulfide reductase family protein [Pseudomonadota bacterium]
MKSVLTALALLAVLAAAPVHAQPAVPAPAPALEGRTVDGKPFQLAALKGKVVLLMYWSTECAVCRDKMPELRQNVEGWRGKPFELVLVSTDRRMEDLQAYEQIIARTVPMKQRFVQLWAGDAGYRDGFGKPAQLPMSFLIDKSGRVVERYQGRIPAEAWDRIAELL